MDNELGLITNERVRRARRSYMFIALGAAAFGILTPFARLLLRRLFPTTTIYEFWRQDLIYVLDLFGPMYLIALPLSIPLFLCAKRTPIDKTKLGFGKYLQYILIAFFVMTAGNTVGLSANAILKVFFRISSDSTATEMILSRNPLIMFVVSVIVAPVVEEFVFRKLIIDRVHVYGGGVAVLVSALMFGLFHGNFSQMFGAFAVGLVFGFVYLKTGKIYYTMIMHALINANANLASLLVRKLMPYFDGSLESIMSHDLETTAESLTEMIPTMLLYTVYSSFITALVAGGVVFFILNLKKKQVTFREECEQLPARRCIGAALVNVGMIVFFLFCAYELAVSLFPQFNFLNRL